MKIYVASSWRNYKQQDVVSALRKEGHEVYDFKNPIPGDHGFSWSEIDPEWKRWNLEQFVGALDAVPARRGYNFDIDAMEWADVGLLVMPAGLSTHLELGWFAGNPDKRSMVLLDEYDDEVARRHLMSQGHTLSSASCPECYPELMYKGKRTMPCRYCLLDPDKVREAVQRPFEPELMYKMADFIGCTLTTVVDALEAFEIDDGTREA